MAILNFILLQSITYYFRRKYRVYKMEREFDFENYFFCSQKMALLEFLSLNMIPNLITILMI